MENETEFQKRRKLVRGAFVATSLTTGIVLSGLMVYMGAQKKEDLIKSNEPIIGTVLEESYKGNLENGSTYTLKVKADDGRIMGVSIIDGAYYSSGSVKKESLDAIVDVGSRISFPKGNMRNQGNADYMETVFENDTRMGTKRAYRVTVLDE